MLAPRSIVLRLGWAELSPPAEAVTILEPIARGGDLRAIEQLAHALVETGKLEAAAHLLEHAQGVSPGEGSVAAGLGEVYAAQGRLDEAQHQLELSDRLRPGHLRTPSQLAALYARRNDRAQALDAVARALEAHPVDAQREALEALRLQLQSGRVAR